VTGYAVTTREPEFDDGDLERFLALRQYHAGVCSCGVHESLAADKNNVFAFEYRTCNVCKGLAQYQRIAADEAKRIAEQFENQPLINPRPTDGRHLMVRPMGPMEVAARRAERGGARSP
jgi:hypothetical protein